MRSIFVSAVLAATLVTTLITPSAGAQANCVQPNSQHLIVYHAGSLTAAFGPVEKTFTCIVHAGATARRVDGWTYAA